jgi:hypothetical protein
LFCSLRFRCALCVAPRPRSRRVLLFWMNVVAVAGAFSRY